MENEAIGARSYLRLSRETLEKFIRSMCRQYRLPKVKIEYQDLGRWAAEWEYPNILRFGKKTTSRDLLTAAHELAHYLHSHIAPNNEHEPHGAEFMGCYMSVLDTVRFIPVRGMRAICDSYQIRYVDPGTTSSYLKLTKAVWGRKSGRPRS
jgi:hypothetical protein